MSTIFASSVDVAERLQVVRGLSREQCETALANTANERLQATVIKALQARLRRLSKVRVAQVSLPCPIETRKALRASASYHGGQSRNQPCCDGCKHQDPAWSTRRPGQHGTGCGFFKLPVLTHAVCEAHQKRSRA